MNREEWLSEMAEKMKPEFSKRGFPVAADIKVSCGFGMNKKAIGLCVDTKDRFELFVSPRVSDPMQVCDILVHEIVHTVVGVEAKHGKKFAECALAMGLKGPMRCTTGTEESQNWIQPLIDQMAEPYPHKEMQPLEDKPKEDRPKTTFKVVCPSCGYTYRLSKKWLEVAVPVCPLHGEMQVEQ